MVKLTSKIYPRKAKAGEHNLALLYIQKRIRENGNILHEIKSLPEKWSYFVEKNSSGKCPLISKTLEIFSSFSYDEI